MTAFKAQSYFEIVNYENKQLKKRICASLLTESESFNRNQGSSIPEWEEPLRQSSQCAQGACEESPWQEWSSCRCRHRRVKLSVDHIQKNIEV